MDQSLANGGEARAGVLLVNLGTPDAPRTREVRRYLRQFLSDPLVLDMHPLLRTLFLYLVILPTRPRSSARAYAQIWRPEGSPLLAHGRALQDAVADVLGPDYVVELAMRYGQPAISEGLSRLRGQGVNRIVCLPLFPQYSTAATLSSVAEVERVMAAEWEGAALKILPPFFAHSGFIAAVSDIARPALAGFGADHVVLSYHGLPERHLRKLDPSGEHCLANDSCCDDVGELNRDCYRAQCLATSRAIARALDLAPQAHSTAFQSRLGRTPWIRPYTDELLPELAAAGFKRLAILCPSFVADCLETLEEIGIRARAQWRDLGADDLLLVPCVNAHPTWVSAVALMVQGALGGVK